MPQRVAWVYISRLPRRWGWLSQASWRGWEPVEAWDRRNQGNHFLGGPWLCVSSWSLRRERRCLSNNNEATACLRLSLCSNSWEQEWDVGSEKQKECIRRWDELSNHQSLQKQEYSSTSMAPGSGQYRTNFRENRKVSLAEKIN